MKTMLITLFLISGFMFLTSIAILQYLIRVTEKLGGKPPRWFPLAAIGYVNEHIREHGDKKQIQILNLMYVAGFSSLILFVALFFYASI
jgi:hypothetical protein